MTYAYLVIHTALYGVIFALIYRRKRHIQYHYSMGLTITAGLSNTLIMGILLCRILYDHYSQAVLAAIAVGLITGILLGAILDFQSMYSGSVAGIMGGFMGPMLGSVIEQNQTSILFFVLEIIFSGLIFFSLFSTQLKREM